MTSSVRRGEVVAAVCGYQLNHSTLTPFGNEGPSHLGRYQHRIWRVHLVREGPRIRRRAPAEHSLHDRARGATENCNTASLLTCVAIAAVMPPPSTTAR